MVGMGFFPCKGKFALEKEESNPVPNYHLATRLFV
jgi:hypothetical protein